MSRIGITMTDKEPPLDVQLQSAHAELHRLKYGAVNAGFIQVSKMYIAEMKDLAQHAPSAHTVLWTLVQEMNKQNAVMISQDSLAKLTKLSIPTVKRAVAMLREQQWLEVLKVGTANVYRVNSEVFWQDRADGRWTSFQAQVVANFDEQDEVTKKMPSVRTRHIPLVEADDANQVHGQQKELPLPPSGALPYKES
jgi:Fe2+ or Zn2+ uptake regulation protein